MCVVGTFTILSVMCPTECVGILIVLIAGIMQNAIETHKHTHTDNVYMVQHHSCLTNCVLPYIYFHPSQHKGV